MRSVIAVFCLLFAAPAYADRLSEDFDNAADLAGKGWSVRNSSTAPSGETWSQGLDGVFESESGVPDSYVGVGSASTTGDTGETISNWLFTPTLAVDGAPTLSFFSRTVDFPASPDRLEVRLSTSGNSADVGVGAGDVGDFAATLLTINPNLTTADYPNAWMRYDVVLPAFPVGTTGRIAFRYFVTDAGSLDANGDYIGVDTVRVAETVTVPENGAAGLLALAAPLLLLAQRYGKRRSTCPSRNPAVISPSP